MRNILCNMLSKAKGRSLNVTAAFAVFVLVLSGAVAIGNANAITTTKGDYTATAGLAIRERGRLNTTSKTYKTYGYGYPGHRWTADCAALSGDWVKIPNTNISVAVWLSNRDQLTTVKGYSSVAYMFAPSNGKLTINLPGQYENKDTCWFSGKAA